MNKIARVITVPSEETARNPHYIIMVGIVLWCLRWQGRRASRRSVADICADILRDTDCVFREADGSAFEIGDLDDELGGDSFDVIRALFEGPLKSEPSRPQRGSLRTIRLLAALLHAAGPRLWRDNPAIGAGRFADVDE